METEPNDFDQVKKIVETTIHTYWKSFLIQGGVMVLLGLLAVSLPHVATIAFGIGIGWLLFIGGILRAATLLKSRHAPGFILSLLTAALAAVLGVVLLAQPMQGALTLTIVLIVIFIVEGVAAILIALDFRRHVRAWGWTLFSGMINLFLAYFLWNGLPSTANWALGLLIGLNMFMTGLALIMMSLAARNLNPEK
ncbi:MAG: DUF308 domain-containing protein [Rhodospirillales bacterium]|nr:DUF308 domain-containing protein [Rhodospirillales bacterium]